MERMDFMELLGRELTSTLPTTLEADSLFNSYALVSLSWLIMIMFLFMLTSVYKQVACLMPNYVSGFRNKSGTTNNYSSSTVETKVK